MVNNHTATQQQQNLHQNRTQHFNVLVKLEIKINTNKTGARGSNVAS